VGSSPAFPTFTTSPTIAERDRRLPPASGQDWPSCRPQRVRRRRRRARCRRLLHRSRRQPLANRRGRRRPAAARRRGLRGNLDRRAARLAVSRRARMIRRSDLPRPIGRPTLPAGVRRRPSVPPLSFPSCGRSMGRMAHDPTRAAGIGVAASQSGVSRGRIGICRRGVSRGAPRCYVPAAVCLPRALRFRWLASASPAIRQRTCACVGGAVENQLRAYRRAQERAKEIGAGKFDRDVRAYETALERHARAAEKRRVVGTTERTHQKPRPASWSARGGRRRRSPRRRCLRSCGLSSRRTRSRGGSPRRLTRGRS
jgi:hypothetical protein